MTTLDQFTPQLVDLQAPSKRSTRSTSTARQPRLPPSQPAQMACINRTARGDGDTRRHTQRLLPRDLQWHLGR